MSSPGCRVLVGGFGRPGQRDLDIGRHLVSYLQQLGWPDGVVVEDLSYAAPMVLHRLQELLPGKVLLLGAVQRGVDDAGTLRRYRVDLNPPRPEEVQQRLEESVQGMVDLDHTLAVARHWGGLPADTEVVEVEPGDCSFGLGFSDEMAEVFDPIVAIVREQLDGVPAPVVDLQLERAARLQPEASDGIADLVEYAAKHQEARLLGGRPDRFSGSAEILGLATARRSRPWSTGVGTGSDWCEVIPLDDRRVAVVAGDVGGRGADAVATMSELRAAVRAYAAVDGHSPTLVVQHVDRFLRDGDLAGKATLVYLTVDTAGGEIRFTNAGHCPPLLVSDDRQTAEFLGEASSPPLGSTAVEGRGEAVVHPADGSTLVVFSDGLVAGGTRSLPAGLEALRRAADDGPDGVDDLCDHLLSSCLAGMRRDDDVCLLAVELPSADGARQALAHRTGAAPAPAPPAR